MTVHGADAVEAAVAGGADTLEIGRTDLVTPLARERARDLGIRIVVRSTATATASTGGRSQVATTTAPDPAPGPARTAMLGAPPQALRPPSPALYRRGAPLAPGLGVRHKSSTTVAPVGPASGRVRRVSVVGAGNVGMITAMRLAESDLIDEVVLVDIAENRAAGIALDLTHSSALLGFTTRVRGVGTLAEAGESEYVVITAGRARTPGMSRADLVGTNATIVGGLAAEAVRVSPDTVLLIVTNPLDEMTQHACAVSGLPTSRVIGMAGVLDSARFQALTALAAGVSPTAVEALALGSHGDEMVLPLSQVTVSGEPADRLLPRPVVDGLVDRARNSGAEVVSLLETGSAFFAPGLSAARMVLAMITESGEVLAATVAPAGEYGIDRGYVGLPVRLGRRGLAGIVELAVTDAERRQLQIAARNIAERVRGLDTVAR